MNSLRIVFMGTPDFAVPGLECLISAGHHVVAAYSQPPRPAGRGHKLTSSPVHRAAERHGIPVVTPKTLKTAEAQAVFAAHGADVAVVAAYGLILPQAVLDAPRLGCVNVHASLLPRWRGAAPIQRAILAGDTATGITLMQMDAGLDTGAMLAQRAIAITPDMTADLLHDGLAQLGADLLPATLAGLAAGTVTAIPQPEDGVTYARKIGREDGLVDWQDATFVCRQVRALGTWPGVVFRHGDADIRIRAAEQIADADPKGAVPGTVLDDRLTIACAAGGAVRPTLLQRPGRSATETEAFLRGYPIAPGTTLCPASS